MNNEVEGRLIDAKQAAAKVWDAVVIGAGVGGCATANKLVSSGLNVLLVDRGKAAPKNLSGGGLEKVIEGAADRVAEGLWPEKITTVVDGSVSKVWAPLGCGVGGSSLLFAATLNRFEPIDFQERQLSSQRTVAWPFTYDELEPYYEEAESLFNVRGGRDPLSTQKNYELKEPLPMCEADAEFFQGFEDIGLHPYRLHSGLGDVADCDGCGGRVCSKSCKQDAVKSCILTLGDTPHLSILESATAEYVEATDSKVEGVSIVTKEGQFLLTSKIFVLAGGAYSTPGILLRSKSQYWPKGLGNHYDLVGRNLMFHVSEFVGIWPKRKLAVQKMRHAIALRDFYSVDGEKYGELQSTGMEAGYGNVLYFLRSKAERSWMAKIPLINYLMIIPAYIGAKLFSDATVFACILEDFPYPENRVVVDDSSLEIKIDYKIHRELKQRVKSFRKQIKKRMKGYRLFPLTDGVTLNYGHPCGSCAAGDSAEVAVVDKNCKVFGVDNLYITDSSFMPTSGGANPSLTIAANALRVSEVIVRHYKSVQE